MWRRAGANSSAVCGRCQKHEAAPPLPLLLLLLPPPAPAAPPAPAPAVRVGGVARGATWQPQCDRLPTRHGQQPTKALDGRRRQRLPLQFLSEPEQRPRTSMPAQMRGFKASYRRHGLHCMNCRLAIATICCVLAHRAGQEALVRMRRASSLQPYGHCSSSSSFSTRDSSHAPMFVLFGDACPKRHALCLC